ncbi:hypothetical protein [Paraburkholderia mimosarum]|uniref:hypothetical protein n=1 Tax=Paraburkholderia mimosarum TaxID=312026 RepID=UPI0012DBDECC|nr:hypothetical protein [Paraburkholderia mimosarum]
MKSSVVNYLAAWEQVDELVARFEECRGQLVGETDRIVASSAGVEEKWGAIGERLDLHLLALADGKADHDELVAAVADQAAWLRDITAAMRALELRLPDPTAVRREIQMDLWETFRLGIHEVCAEAEAHLRNTVLELTRQAADTVLDAMRRGYLEPHRPAEGASLKERVRFHWARAVFHVRKHSVALAVAFTAVFVVAVQYAASELHSVL